MGVSTLTFLGIVFWMEGDSTHALVAFSSCTALIAFLLFNWNPARIFMGDTGSLVLGFINAVLVVRFIAFFTNQEATSIFSAAPAIGFALYFVPMADLLRLFIARLQLGKSPFEPDMQHLHHELLRNGLSHWQTSIVLVVSNGLFLAYSIFLQQLGNTVLILSMFGIASVLFLGYKRISIKSGSPNLKESSEQVPVETITRIINRDSFEEVKLLQ
jgi:UDP-N-acetylmuramyl pentapeptide phosphotransferase/UDP-N-acetylglucosamine-1-phosphate transferase